MLGEAAAFLGQHLDIQRILGPRRWALMLNVCAASREELDRAARLFGCSEAVRDGIDLPVWPLVAELERRFRQDLRTRLGDDHYDVEHGRGRGLDPAAVVDDLLDRSAIHDT